MNPTKQLLSPLADISPDIVPNSSAFIEDAREESHQVVEEWYLQLWDRRKSLWRATIIALVAATLLALLIPNTYQSTTRLMPPDQQSGSGIAIAAALMGKAGAGMGTLAGDLLGVKGSGALFTDVLRSRTVEDRIIDKFDLRKVYRDRYWETARADLADSTGIAEDRKSGVITILVTDRDPRRAAAIAQAYVEELNRLVAEVSTSAARRERIFIEQRLKTVQQDLGTAARQFSEFASQNTAIDIKQQGIAMVEAAARLQGELIAAQSEAQGLEQIYSTNNVRVRSVQARISELKRQLQKLGGDGSITDLNTSGSQQQFPSIRTLPILGVRWAELYRETKVQETVYELLTEQYELAKIQEAKEIPTVKVLDVPDVPERKHGPHRLLIVILGTLLGFSASCAWILGSAVWQHTSDHDPRKIMLRKIATPLRCHLLRVQGSIEARIGTSSKIDNGQSQE